MRPLTDLRVMVALASRPTRQAQPCGPRGPTHACYVPSLIFLVIPDFSSVVARLRQLWIACDPERLRHRMLAPPPTAGGALTT